MAKTFAYQQHAIISAPFEQVWSWLGDPRRHVELHPMIRDLRVLAEGDGPELGERFIDFVVHDEVEVLGLGLAVEYFSRLILRPAAATIQIRATCRPRLVTTVVWTLTEVEGGTRIDEQVELTAPRVLAKFSTGESQRAHQRMWETMQVLVTERQRLSDAVSD